jgi:hypothetical protein
MAQRFFSNTWVFDAYSGLSGEIQEMNLGSAAVPPLAPLYVGPYFAAKLLRSVSPLQTFTPEGRMIDHATGAVLGGVTLLTQAEYTALVAAGYPKN